VCSLRSLGFAPLALALSGALGSAAADPAPYSTPPGVTLVDISTSMIISVPQFLWRRLGDAHGNPLYTYDADARGKSSCYDGCAREFPPFVAGASARGSGDFSIIVRDDHVRQWAYQGKPLYRYSGKDPAGEPIANDAIAGNAADPAWHDPASSIYSPKPGWRRAAYTPEKSVAMPPTVELAGLAIASGFGFVDAASHRTLYAAPPAQALSGDWQPLSASALSVPIGDFSIVTRKQDGTPQWTYKGAALYTYAGDYAPDEVTGIFSGEKSVQVALAYRNFMPAGVDIRHFVGRAPLMTVNGQTLYYVARFFPLYGGRETRVGYGITYNDAKSQGTDACLQECTQTWKPLLAGAQDQARGFWEIIERPDGARQWMFQGSPVYSFVGDRQPGDITGNNRHVIVYGGAQGQVVYLDAGGDPRNVQPSVGKNLSMALAAGPPPPPDSRTKETAVYRAGAGFYWHTLGGLFY
jgi:predicted lipoprotein with Yx(FWY)xxD motif